MKLSQVISGVPYISDAEVDDEEVNLVKRLAQGDEVAEQELVQRYYPRFLKQAQRAGVPYPEYEDTAHEALLGLIQQLRRGAFKKESTFNTWAYRLAANKISDYWRKQARNGQLIQPPSDADGDALDSVASLALVAKPDSDVCLDVRKALKAIAPHYCLLLILNRTYGFSAEEIKGLAINVSNWSKKQIENRIACAQEHFRHELASYKGRTRKLISKTTISDQTQQQSDKGKEDGKSKQSCRARYASLLCAYAQQIAHRILLWTRYAARTTTSRSPFADMHNLSR